MILNSYLCLFSSISTTGTSTASKAKETSASTTSGAPVAASQRSLPNTGAKVTILTPAFNLAIFLFFQKNKLLTLRLLI
jgi:hypothetical protein